MSSISHKGTNLFFNKFTNTDEQNLINDLVYESIKLYGIDCGYMSFTEDDTDDDPNGDTVDDTEVGGRGHLHTIKVP